MYSMHSKTNTTFFSDFCFSAYRHYYLIAILVVSCMNNNNDNLIYAFSTIPITSKSVTCRTRRFVGATIRGGNNIVTSSSSLFLANNNDNDNLLVKSLTSLLPNNNNIVEAITTSTLDKKKNNVALDFIEALNDGKINDAMKLFTQQQENEEELIAEFDDTQFYQSCIGTEQIERRLRLMIQQQEKQQQDGPKEVVIVDDIAIDYNRNTIGVLFHKEQQKQGKTIKDIPNSRGCIIFHLVDDKSSTSSSSGGGGRGGSDKSIQKICWVKEPTTRGGEVGLKLLSTANKIMQITGYNPEANNKKKKTIKQQQQQQQQTSSNKKSLTPPEQYFEAWNQRDMVAAVQVFDDNLKYEDTAFPEPFVGKEKLKEHLFKCSDGFPSTFQIIIDRVAVDTKSNTAACEWHFETSTDDNDEGSDSEALPFTQGCSFYKLSNNNNNNNNNKIVEGIDFIEPAVIKLGGVSLFAKSIQTKLLQEPIRLIPAVSWIAYMYIVFFSDGILPGANALQLEGRTWEEVSNLSLNFFLVAPLLDLSFSPSVHPMLEGVFNLLLSWAAMFAGFLSDDRRNKPNLLPMFPIVVGMQFLTSAFLLPYLAVRSNEETVNSSSSDIVSSEELSLIARKVGESRILPALMAMVGTGSIAWFFLGRAEEYGTVFATRYASFIDLLSIDRVGSSFLVDLAIFALFQGWLVDDDLKRRGDVADGGVLVIAAKYVPFFGMAAYLLLRPSLSETNSEVK